jgi:hypothetical protein
VLLDMVRYWAAKGTPVDPWTDHAITSKELEECAKLQGVAFRKGDILLIRAGFIRKYHESTPEERDRLSNLEVELCKLCVCLRPRLRSQHAADPAPAARASRPRMT